ncbi:MAG: HAD-IIB family hydrolase [Melioribacteraceae bacterium]|nr:HAD-IIB family hydrolase [Melioribacteraceae bacterium]
MKNEKGLYIQLYNIHGLIRGENLELGRDSDTGGQTKYVLELAKNLSERNEIRKVEIMTRLIDDKDLSESYSVKYEKINEKLFITRIQCGGKKYIRKELLWDHLEEYADKTIKYIKSTGEIPDLIHSHYADAGYVCTQLTRFLGIPLIHTGHSLGRLKRQNLLGSGLTEDEIDKRYKISRRIEAEESVMFFSDRIITSTNQEIESQYGMYQNMIEEKFRVIPPGIELDKFFPYNQQREWDDHHQVIRYKIRDELLNFFNNIHKPLILSLCRPEKRKNISGLIEAFGRSEELQQKANLAIYAGIRKDIQEMPELEREVLTEMLLLMDKYNLYGKMAIPKKHDFEHEVPELYRTAAETGGVFVNSAFAENFGLTLIESASSGLPIVSTDDGGPRDIINNLQNGILVDVKNPENIADAVNKILDNKRTWKEFSENGIHRVGKFYSWKAHVDNYLETINELLEETTIKPKTFIDTGKQLFGFQKLIMLDIDDTITGDTDALTELKEIILTMDERIGFGVATGRHIESACDILQQNNFAKPHIIVSSVGSEIYYRNRNDYDYSTSWEAHIKNSWKPERIMELLDDFEFLELQTPENQRKFKVSYNLHTDEKDLQRARDILIKNKIKTNLIVSHGAYVDFLPFRASKGRAIRYLSYRWNIPHKNILVGGDSGNDEDMLTGELLGVVVANHTEDLEKLRGRRRIYFSEQSHANGVTDGIKYYNFLRGDLQ